MEQTQTSKKVLSSSRLVKCPVCFSKLCKIKEYDEGTYIEVKHKRALMIASEAVVRCRSADCGRHYHITTNGLEKEVNLGRE